MHSSRRSPDTIRSVTDDIQARFEDIERRLAALEAAPREPAAEAATTPVGVVPAWLQPLDELFKSGNPARALAQAEKLRALAYAAASTTQLEELHAYLSGVARTVAYPRLTLLLVAIERDLNPPQRERRTDLRPFPASMAAPPVDGSVAATGDSTGDASKD